MCALLHVNSLVLCSVGTNVRAVAWKKTVGGGLAIGCLDGACYYWNPIPTSNTKTHAAPAPPTAAASSITSAASGGAQSATAKVVEPPRAVFAVSCAVTCMHWENVTQSGGGGGGSGQGFALVCGTVDGRVVVMRHNSERDPLFRVELVWRAHAPVTGQHSAAFREKFGSLHLAADVWSVRFSPDNKFIVSASEDQSTVRRCLDFFNFIFALT
jgi:hypothetical protein